MSAIDPSGLKGYLCQNGNNIGIAIPIHFKGGSAADRARIVGAIQSQWSGRIGSYNVSTTVRSVSSSNSAVNTVHIVSASRGADGELSRVHNNQYGVFFTGGTRAGDLDYGHEAGHFLGLGEQNNLAEAAYGMPPTIMDQYNPAAHPNGADISDALKSAGNVK